MQLIATAELGMITNIQEESARLRPKHQSWRNRLACSHLRSPSAIDLLLPESYIEHYFLGGLFCLPVPPPNPVASSGFNDGSEQQRAHPPAPHSRRNQRIVHQLFDERHRLSRIARRARRTQAGAPPRALCHERARTRSRPSIQEVRDGRRRRTRQVPPAR